MMNYKRRITSSMGTLVPNIKRGGQAIPIGNNLYLMKGRQHSAGGIDVGTDLEVENNEVMQMLPNETRVFSSMPMLGGYSPAQLVANGNNLDLVFNAQERWKKRNRVHDDGSIYKDGGTKKYKTMNKQSLINSNTIGSIVRMDGSGIDKLAYIPFTGNRQKTLKAGGRDKAPFGTFARDNLFNVEYLVDPYTTYNKTKVDDSTDNDIFKERMKFIEPYFEGQSDIPGYINAGANALGSIVTSLIANNAINKQRPPVAPMPLIAPKLKTNVNINADLDANREATRLAIHDIKKNTASSQVGRNLINQQLFAKALADSKLYTDAENKRTELINADITQRAGIVNENIKMGNTYRQALADFYSNKALAKGQNWAQMVNGLGQAIGIGLNNIGATNTKKLNALIATLPAIETFLKNKKP